MTLIVHRCQVCHHVDVHHTGQTECCAGHCRTGAHALVAGPSEYLMTYAPTGAVSTTMAAPGTRYTAFGHGAPVVTCSCAGCWELYRQWTGRTGAAL